MYLLDFFLVDHPRADEIRRSVARIIGGYSEALRNGREEALDLAVTDNLLLQEEVNERIE